MTVEPSTDHRQDDAERGPAPEGWQWCVDCEAWLTSVDRCNYRDCPVRDGEARS